MDLDKSGFSHKAQRTYLGPSLGWTDGQQNVLAVAAGGITAIDLNITLVTVNFNGAVTIQLPKARGVGQNLGTLTGNPITIVDIGGFASANPITILPAPGETIMSLASIQIASMFGSFSLTPNVANGGWNA